MLVLLLLLLLELVVLLIFTVCIGLLLVRVVVEGVRTSDGEELMLGFVAAGEDGILNGNWFILRLLDNLT